MAHARVAVRGALPLAHTVPLYAASALVTLCGIGAVIATVDGLPEGHLWLLLAVGGHLVSYFLRRQGVDAVLLLLPITVAGALWIAAGLPAYYAALNLPPLPPDMELARLIAWLAVFRGFTLVNNSALLFSAVPTLAMLGLMASNNLNVEMSIFFGVFVFGTIFMAVYEQHLQRVELLRGTPRPVSWHLVTTTGLFAICLLGGSLVAVVGRPLLGKLAPYGLPLLGSTRLPQLFTTATQSLSNHVPVGAGPIYLSEEPLLEVYTAEAAPLFLRTAVLDRYVGNGWAVPSRDLGTEVTSVREVEPEPPPGKSITASRWFAHSLGADPDLKASRGVRQRPVDQLVYVLGSLGPRLPTLVRPVEVRYPGSRLRVQDNGGVSGMAFLQPGFAYRVRSQVVTIDPNALRSAPAPVPVTSDLQPYLSIPVHLLQRLQETASAVTAGLTNNYDRTEAIIRHIERTCSYTVRGEPTPFGQDAVEHYLFKTRRGACDLAASAAVLLCRAAGIPARAAIGYLADEPLPNGNGYLVRQKDAHMWFEVYFPDYGWVAFNPAPAVADVEENAVAMLFGDVQRFLRSLFGSGLAFYLFSLAAMAVIASVLHLCGGPALRALVNLLGRRRAPSSPAQAAYQAMLRHLARCGWPRQPNMTPLEYQWWLERQWDSACPACEAIQRLTEAFQAALYGRPASAGAPDEGALRAELRRLRETAPRAPGPPGRRFPLLFFLRSAVDPR